MNLKLFLMGVFGYKRFFRLSFNITLCFSMLIPSLANSAGNVSPEYKLKAALLYKLTKFVEWPAEQQNKKVFGLCVLGENYFGDSLIALESRKVTKRTIKIHYFDQSDAITDNCDLVFISDSKKAFIKPILKPLRQQPVLTVADVNEFAEQGGIVQFTAGKRIGFKINHESAKRAGLKIAAPLLQLATIVNSKD